MYQVKTKIGDSRFGSIPLDTKQKVREYIGRTPGSRWNSKFTVRDINTGKIETGTRAYFRTSKNWK